MNKHSFKEFGAGGMILIYCVHGLLSCSKCEHNKIDDIVERIPSIEMYRTDSRTISSVSGANNFDSETSTGPRG